MLSSPAAISHSVFCQTEGGQFCLDCGDAWVNSHQELAKLFYVSIIFVSYLIPLTVFCVTNFVTCEILREHEVSADANVNIANARNRSRQANNNARKLLSIVTITFFASWTPYYVSLSIQVLFYTNIPPLLQNLFVSFYLFGSCINPILYGCLSERYQSMFAGLLPTGVLRDR